MGSLPVVNPIEDRFGRLHCPGGGDFSHKSSNISLIHPHIPNDYCCDGRRVKQ
jgi:hypothetical protein